ncbi:MAG: hypothetical protein ACO1OB_34850 [Archangium sp.]
MSKSFLALTISLALFSGCAHTPKEKVAKTPNPAEVAKVQRRAEADLGCSQISVEVLEEGNMMRPWTFVAKGCDKTATYISSVGGIMRN